MERPGSWGQGRGTAPDRSRQNGHSTAASNTDVAAPRQREPSSTARPSEALSCGLSMLYAGGSDTACRCKHPATTPSTSAAMIATPISARVSRKCPPTAPGQVLGTAADPSQHDGQLTTGRCPPGPSRRHRGQDEAAPSGAPDNSGPTAREPDAGWGREAKRPAPGARRPAIQPAWPGQPRRKGGGRDSATRSPPVGSPARVAGSSDPTRPVLAVRRPGEVASRSSCAPAVSRGVEGRRWWGAACAAAGGGPRGPRGAPGGPGSEAAGGDGGEGDPGDLVGGAGRVGGVGSPLGLGDRACRCWRR